MSIAAILAVYGLDLESTNVPLTHAQSFVNRGVTEWSTEKPPNAEDPGETVQFKVVGNRYSAVVSHGV